MNSRSPWSEAMQPISESRRTSVVLSLVALAIVSADLGGEPVVHSAFVPLGAGDRATADSDGDERSIRAAERPIRAERRAPDDRAAALM